MIGYRTLVQLTAYVVYSLKDMVTYCQAFIACFSNFFLEWNKIKTLSIHWKKKEQVNASRRCHYLNFTIEAFKNQQYYALVWRGKKCYGVSTLPQVSSDGSTATITPLARIPPCRTHNSEFTIISLPASANNAGSLKCLPVVRSDWAVQATPNSQNDLCPPGRAPRNHPSTGSYSYTYKKDI
jgi:hypothetical protein